MQLAFLYVGRGRWVPGYNSLVPEVQGVFNLINNTGLNEVQPAPNWEDFIQNSLISCFINLKPQAEMFKAAGRPGPVVLEKRANEGEGKKWRNYVCMFGNTSSGVPTIPIIKVIWEVSKLYGGIISHTQAALSLFLHRNLLVYNV